MAFKKCKVCPACGICNPPNRLECQECQTDLTRVRVANIDPEQQEHTTAIDPQQSTCVEKSLFRVCECGEMNPPQARKCMACGEDISDILPVAANPNQVERFSYVLRTVDGEHTYTIDKPIIILGREAELKEYLANKSFVSRRHAKLTTVAGKVFIENLSETNRTFVNSKLICSTTPKALVNGDEIGLGGTALMNRRQESAAYFIYEAQR